MTQLDKDRLRDIAGEISDHYADMRIAQHAVRECEERIEALKAERWQLVLTQ